MSTLRLPWAAWYGDGELALAVPDTWRVIIARPRDAAGLAPAELKARLRQPIATLPLRTLASGKKRVVLVIDDLSRPTPTAQLLPLVLEELRAGGVGPDAVHILLGQATHRPLGRPDFLKKLGPLADDLRVTCHNPYENLVFVGTTAAGTPVWISRWYTEADLRVTIGCVEPHPAYGFSGGAKLVFPGLAGMDSIYANHRPGHLPGGILHPETNAKRLDAEEAVRMAGLDLVINAVINTRREVAGLFAGDFVAAHRTAAAFADQVYATPVPAPADVLVLNAYPKDTELIQVNNAANALGAAKVPVMHDRTVVVITTAASEGAGWHALANPGGRMYERPSLHTLQGRPVIVFCPHGRAGDLPPSLPKDAQFCRTWEATVQAVARLTISQPNVLVFPEGPLQIPVTPT